MGSGSRAGGSQRVGKKAGGRDGWNSRASLRPKQQVWVGLIVAGRRRRVACVLGIGKEESARVPKRGNGSNMVVAIKSGGTGFEGS
eukprot:11447515-Ditylum_brightwellii.AAC.1